MSLFGLMDWRRVGKMYLPQDLRRLPKWQAMVEVLLLPLNTLHARFRTERELVNTDAGYGAQTLVMKRLLELTFSGRVNQVEVTNANTQLDGVLVSDAKSWPEEEVYVYDAAEVVSGAEEVYIDAEGTYTEQADFTVRLWVRAGQTITEAEVRAVVNKYKTYGTIYTVILT